MQPLPPPPPTKKKKKKKKILAMRKKFLSAETTHYFTYILLSPHDLVRLMQDTRDSYWSNCI